MATKISQSPKKESGAKNYFFQMITHATSFNYHPMVGECQMATKNFQSPKRGGGGHM